MTKSPIVTVVISLALLCLGVVGYKLGGRTLSTANMVPLSPCDPGSGTCRVSIPQGGELVFSLEPRPIRPLQKLTLTAITQGLPTSGIEVDFDGVDMSMGYNRVRLSGENGHFSGQAILPVCITGNMKWKATVLIEAGNGQTIAITFHFDIAGR